MVFRKDGARGAEQLISSVRGQVRVRTVHFQLLGGARLRAHFVRGEDAGALGVAPTP